MRSWTFNAGSTCKLHKSRAPAGPRRDSRAARAGTIPRGSNMHVSNILRNERLTTNPTPPTLESSSALDQKRAWVLWRRL
eukprot:5926856-Pyramimonas_sp.AAC.1